MTMDPVQRLSPMLTEPLLRATQQAADRRRSDLYPDNGVLQERGDLAGGVAVMTGGSRVRATQRCTEPPGSHSDHDHNGSGSGD